MKFRIKKYFVIILAFSLILSNFSFAASYIHCKMSKSGYTCMCEDEHHDNDNPPGTGIGEKENSCCEKEIKVLSNTVNLLSFKPNIKHDLKFSLIASISNIDLSRLKNLQISGYNYIEKRIPPSDITITTSNLLI